MLADEGLEPHTVGELWIGGGPDANRHVDITASIDKKIAALQCHVSQVSSWEEGRLDERMREWASRNATTAGLEAGRYAESFRCVVTT